MNIDKMRIFFKWKMFIFILTAIFFFVILLHHIRELRVFVNVHKNIKEYCNDPLLPEKGEEGYIPYDPYELISLTTVIRHGDRSPIHLLYPEALLSNTDPKTPKNPFICKIEKYPNILKNSENVEFLEYYKAIHSLKHEQTFKSQSILYSNMSLFPNEEYCSAGALTPIGAAQHIRLGEFFEKRYMKQGLMRARQPEVNMFVVTTLSPRTLQSAIAFLFGLLEHFSFSQIKFNMANDAKMCNEQTKLSCSCSSVDKFINKFSVSYAQNWTNQANFGDARLGSRVANNMFLPVDTDGNPRTDPGKVFDFLATHHCHSKRATVNDDSGLVFEVVDFINWQGRQAVRDEQYRNISIFKMLPLISEIEDKLKSYHVMYMKNDGKGAKDYEPFFNLYSGHDSTIEPLAMALGISDGHWPRYASRIVFEQYIELEKKQNSYIRVLYNGKDKTSDLTFCQSAKEQLFGGYLATLCPLANFTAFVKDYVRDYRTMCDQQ